MIVLFLVVILFTTAPQEANRPSQVPVAVPEREAAEHLIGDRPIVRVSPKEAQHLAFFGIKVHVTVDSSGSVVTAKVSGDHESELAADTLTLAESLVRALRYRPFERAGRPVSVEFDEYVFPLPPEIQPSRNVPFPKVKDLKSVKITLDRYKCYGSCPSYKVVVEGDGTIEYDGRSNVTFTGHHRGLVPKENVLELLNIFKSADYFSLNDEYRMSVTDSPTYVTSIEMDGRRKQVTDYVGEEIGMPLAVSHLESEIDRLSGSARWVTGNADTLRALKAEHWDFKSPEAISPLDGVAENGNIDAVRDLLSAGVGQDGSGPASVLVIAAQRGNLAMVGLALDAGAAATPGSLDVTLPLAAESGNVEVFRLLVRNGAHSDVHDSKGRTILMNAAASGFPAMVRETLKYPHDVNAVIEAQERTEAKTKGDTSDEDSEDDKPGRTALMEAVSQRDSDVEPEGMDRAEVVRLLLAAGADPNFRDKRGNTALILCTERADIALLLIKASADVNATNDEGESPLSKADSDEVKRVLIEHGAKDTAPDKEKDQDKDNDKDR